MLMLDVYLVDYQVKVNYSLIVIFWKELSYKAN